MIGASDSVSPAEQAAIILMLMNDEEAASLLGQLDPGELQLIGQTMLALPDVESRVITDAIGGFIREAQGTSLESRDRRGSYRNRMVRALGEVKADSIMQKICPEQTAPSLELAHWLAPQVLASLVQDEHPQVIAVLLLVLEAEQGAALLSLLPPDIQPGVVERIARLRKVSTQAFAMLDEILTAKISKRFGSGALAMGGARDAADLINRAAGPVAKSVIPDIGKRDAALAKAIEAELFTFEMILALSPMDMGRLLREVENEVLVDALKGLEEDERTPFFAAMSSRAADGVKDEIELRGKLKREDVQAAQKSMVNVLRQLADAGEVSVGSDDAEFV
ncbi:flagellar motor switch protein FliG [Erythrobacter sp. EC-HK427]|uniref:flagellar motor switch protein FliG n=1 Tax=Erythrobacter sp. EC-HK427 TaxID=2038396 RepID=UPI001257DA62|nr:FliG C-terminal domain-containing protein [Erythrobacter sp. EC-HK427]VVT01667.1 Flagellar motor switch protein [Erythrobacter sp. EC-HK427]